MDKQTNIIARNNKTFNSHPEGAEARDAWIKFYIEQFAPECKRLDPTFEFDQTSDGAMYEFDMRVLIDYEDIIHIEMGLSEYAWINNNWEEV